MSSRLSSFFKKAPTAYVWVCESTPFRWSQYLIVFPINPVLFHIVWPKRYMLCQMLPMESLFIIVIACDIILYRIWHWQLMIRLCCPFFIILLWLLVGKLEWSVNNWNDHKVALSPCYVDCIRDPSVMEVSLSVWITSYTLSYGFSPVSCRLCIQFAGLSKVT